MAKPKFTPDPVPDGMDPQLAEYLSRQLNRIEDWWPKDYEERIQALEQLAPYCTGTWPIVDYSNITFESVAEIIASCVDVLDCDASTIIWPLPGGGNLNKPFVMSNCKFTNTVNDPSVYAMLFTDDAGQDSAGPQHGFLLRYCDVDLQNIGSTTAFFGQFTFPASKARLLSGETYNTDKVYINVDTLSQRITDVQHDYVTTPTAGYGAQAYAGEFPIPSVNVVNVSPGVDTFKNAIAAANDGDNLVLSAGTYSHSLSGSYTPNFAVNKNIRIYGATGNPDDVIITMKGGSSGWLQWNMTTIPCTDDPCGNSIMPGMFNLTLRPQDKGNPSTWGMLQLRAEI